MADEKLLPLQGEKLALPADAARELAKGGRTLRLAYASPRLLAVVGGDELIPEGTGGNVALIGDLRHIPAPDLIGLLTMSQKSGMLRLLRNDGDCSIYFERGEIVFANSDQEKDRLGNFLYRRGLIDKKDLAEAEKRVQPGTRFGKVLVEMNLIGTKELWEAVRAQVEEIIYSIFTSSDGEFVFVEGASLLAEDLSGFSLSGQNLIMEGIRRSDEMPMIESMIPSDECVPVHREKAPGTDLAEHEREIFKLIDGRKNIRQIMRASKRGEFDVKRALYDLAKSKFIDIKVPGQAAGKRDPAERMREAIAEYNRIFAQISKDLETYRNVSGRNALSSFFDDLSGSRFAHLFQGVKLGEDGALDARKLFENAQKPPPGENAALAIAGLSELLRYELLVDGLNEFLNFAIFTVRNNCEDAQAAEIIKKIRQIQSGLMS